MGWDRQRKREKNYTPEIRSFSTLARKFQKKYRKKLKNQFPALFLDKTRWDRPRKRKNFTPELCSCPTWARNFQIKNSIKIQNIKKVNSYIISIQNGFGEGKKEKNKFIPEFRSYSTRARKFRKKKVKKFKKLKKPFPALFFAKTG